LVYLNEPPNYETEMIVIVLCGGTGTRMLEYSFPKPLNMIWGKPAIYYTLKHLPEHVETIHFVVAPHLQKHNFNETVTNIFRSKKCIFHNLPYFTRGAAESAFLGTKDLEESNESILFLDNDVMYEFPSDFFTQKPNAFLGYTEDNTGSEAYSFMKLNEHNIVTEYKEKVRISNKFCCGAYGFQNIGQFRAAAFSVLNSEYHKEIYMSSLYNYMLEKHIPIKGIHFDSSIHTGSLPEIEKDLHRLPKRSMRICFDLDNTLVTYPSVPYDYSTVKPIVRMIELAQKLKSEGHTIIIHTARRMETHKHNIGAVIKDIGLTTFKTLADFNIPCDELLFGKPIADMYIDDRAVNPYRNDMRSMGLIDFVEPQTPINMLATNKYNNITLIGGNIVRKKGPRNFMKGELHFYQSILPYSGLRNYFPNMLGFSVQGESMILDLEHIQGIPIYTLYKNGMLTTTHIDKLFEFLDCLHSQIGSELPTRLNVVNNYTTKLKARFASKEDYPFEDVDVLQSLCLARLESYLKNDIIIKPFIHGDLWFSNIMLDFKLNLKMIDMKGQVDDNLTTGGDIYYDYGKLYQSLLGFDAAIYNDIVLPEYTDSLRKYFIRKLEAQNIDFDNLKTVTFSLIMGTFHSIKSNEAKQRVWNLLHSALESKSL
jgi:capsule biosynthesis phosphatase